jgi:uncharacterized protein YndB with AHSA1/START domain
MTADPKLDLVLERTIDVPPELVWKAWTEPRHLVKWWTPAPWKTTSCEVDLRPGGRFSFAMEGPAGERAAYSGCFLEIVDKRKIVWTLALTPGFRPAGGKSDIPRFTAIVVIEAAKGGTKYTATAMHASEDDAKKHDEMGFHEGWGAALDQLVTVAKKL